MSLDVFTQNILDSRGNFKVVAQKLIIPVLFILITDLS